MILSSRDLVTTRVGVMVQTMYEQEYTLSQPLLAADNTRKSL